MAGIEEEDYKIRCESKDYGLVKPIELFEALALGGVPFYSEILNQPSNQWMPLSSHARISHTVAQAIKCPTGQWGDGSIYGNWFVKNDDKTYGPFSLIQMIELCQQNNLSSDSLIRHPKHRDWQILAETKPFDDKSIKALFQYPGLQQAFTRRKSPRVYYANSVCLSLEEKLYNGVSLSLSKKGIGILVEDNTPVKIKDKINIIINRNSEHGMIQSKCEVVSFNRCDGQDKIGLVFAQEIEPLTEYIERRVPILQTA